MFVAVALAAAAGTLTARWMSRHAQPAPAPKSEEPALTVDPRYLDFGEVWETDKFEWPIIVENRGTETQVVTKVNGSCTCLSITPSEFTLAPGQKLKVQAVLKLRGRSSPSETQTHEDFAVTVWADVSGKSKPVAWQLRGRLKRAISTPDQMDLGFTSRRTPDASAQLFLIKLLDPSIRALEIKSVVTYLRCTSEAIWHRTT